MKPIHLLFSVLFLSLFSNTNAQKQWTLEECLKYALEHNIQLKRQELQTEVAKNELKLAKYNLLPDLSANAGHTLGTGRDYSTFTVQKKVYSNGTISAESNYTIFSGFQKKENVTMQKFNLLSSMEGLEKAKNDISLEIAAAYLQILFNNELLEIAKRQLELSNLQVEKTNKLVEVGNVARGALLEIKAQAASEEANVTDAQNKLNLSNIFLAQLLDLDTVKNFKIFIPAELMVADNFNENTDSIYSIAVENQPQIKQYKYQLESAKSQLAMAKGGRMPTLSLRAGLGTDYNLKTTDISPVGSQINDNIYKQVSLNLSIPIFTKYQIQRNISNAKIGVLDNEFALKLNQITLRKEVEQSYADALAAFENFKSRTEAVTAYEENLNYIQQKFDVGMVNSVDFNIAKNNYAKAKSDLLQAKYQFIFKTKILDFYRGMPIRL